MNTLQNDYSPVDELQYKDEVVTRLVETIEEYLSFSTARELIKLVAQNL
ncbi:MAG TPA: hypothetical protein VM577_00785 [Anaerovoracaceae bacterium]|nr:hypothetical protein [Anaerovoracaceae bacterium]